MGLSDFLWPRESSIYQFHHSTKLERAGLRTYRSFCLCYYLLIAINTILLAIPMQGVSYPFFFMTFWGHLGCLFYFGLVSALEGHVDHNSPPTQGFLWKLAHILFELSFSLEFTICTLYWLLLASYSLQQLRQEPNFEMMSFMNFAVHGFSAIFISIEMMLNSVQFLWRHAIVFLPILMIAYSGVNAFGIHVMGFQIYQPVITWVNIDSYFYMGFAIVLTVAGFALGNMCYKYKQIRIDASEERGVQLSPSLFNDQSASSLLSPQLPQNACMQC